MSAELSTLPQDAYYMTLAIAEAQKGLYTTRPNPAVGCVLVKDGVVIGAGFHPKAGEPHAEVFALKAARQAGYGTSGATAYVTLEPCSHTGRTPPCADALIAAKVARVVVATLDANPKVAGNGIAKLTAAGIAVVVGVCEDQARALNRGFLKAMATGLPFVRLKVAASLDGRVAMASGESKWITSAAAREDVQRLRAMSGAIITGSGTILADNPTLNVRSQALGVPLSAVVPPKIVVVDRRARLEGADFTVLQNPDTLLWRDDLPSLLTALVRDFGCWDVLVEAGSALSGAFIEAGLVDELIIYQAPCVLGASAKPMFDFALEKLDQQKRFALKDAQPVGTDLRLTFHKI